MKILSKFLMLFYGGVENWNVSAKKGFDIYKGA